MHDARAALLGRLDATASSLAQRQGTLALIGLGSVGADLEQRFPRTAPCLGRFMQGYDRSPESALALLEFLEAGYEVDPTLSRRVVEFATEIIANR